MVNDIQSEDQNRKRVILLHSCGKQTYHLLCSLVSPRKLAGTPYEQLCDTLQTQFNPKLTVTVQRYKLNTHTQLPEENVATFVAKLRELAEFCEFGEKLDEHLRERLVCGLRNEQTKRHLFTESKLLFQSAWKISKAMETAKKNVEAIQNESQNGRGNCTFGDQGTTGH